MSSDALIRFEEDNFDDLVEKFIKKHQSEWEVLLMEEFERSCEDDRDKCDYWPPDETEPPYKKY